MVDDDPRDDEKYPARLFQPQRERGAANDNAGTCDTHDSRRSLWLQLVIHLSSSHTDMVLIGFDVQSDNSATTPSARQDRYPELTTSTE